MKKILTSILALLLLAAAVFCLASCSVASYKKKLYNELTTEHVASQGYTAASYKDYESAYLAARKVYENEDATGSDVRNAISDLQKAKKALVKTADFSQLILAIDSHEKIISTMYTEESYLHYQSVYEAALAVYEDDTSGQSTINAAVKALNEAIAGLVEIGDASSLELLVKNHIEKGNYTSASYQQYEDAYTNALQLLQKENATKNETMLAYNFLSQAINGLQEKGDLSLLVSAYNTARSTYLRPDEAGRSADVRYTSGSYNKLTMVLDRAKTAISSGDISKDKVAELVTEINDAGHSLVSLSPLLDRVDQLDTYTSNDIRYTEDSYAALLAAFSYGINVARNPGSTSEEVNNAVEHIDASIEGLVFRRFIPDGRTDKPLLTGTIRVGASTTTVYEYLLDFAAFFNDICTQNDVYAYYTDETSAYVTYGKCTLTMTDGSLRMVYTGNALMSEREEKFFLVSGAPVNASLYDIASGACLGTPTEYINGNAEGGNGISSLIYVNEEAGLTLEIYYNESEMCMTGLALTLVKDDEPDTSTESDEQTETEDGEQTENEQNNDGDANEKPAENAVFTPAIHTFQRG